MGVRRLGVFFAVALSAAVLWETGASLAATGGEECQLQGVANISPPLTNVSGSFAYNFTGTLSSCQSNVAGAPTACTVSAGIQVPETVTLTCSGGPTTGTVLYQEPVPQGSGNCVSSTTSEEVLVTCNDGKHTVLDCTTTGVLAVVVVQCTVVPSVTLTLVASSVPAGCTAPSTYTISTDEPAFPMGDGAVGVLTFSPTTPDQNCATMGVSSANINGVVGLGSAQ